MDRLFQPLLQAKAALDNYTDSGDHFREWSRYCRDNVDIPIVISIIYVALVFKGQEWMAKREPLYVKPFFVVWNLGLAIFSMIGVVPVAQSLIEQTEIGGFKSTICGPYDPEYERRTIRFWIGIFCLSKIPELMDTAFLVMKKKPVIFLHWYHHFTVLLYCWVALGTQAHVGAHFAAMNYTVHSIMYLYFAVASINKTLFKLVKPVGIIITVLQISQMVGGLVLICIAAYWSANGGCPGTPAMPIRAGLLMYLSYFVLFMEFFFKNYVRKPKRQPSQPAVAAAAGAVATETSTGGKKKRN